MGFVRAYRPGDECDLAPRLREADLRQLKAVTILPPVEIIRMGAEQSAPSCTIVGNSGLVAGIFGVRPEDCRVWLLGSDELVTKPLVRQFLRECRTWCDSMLDIYPILHNIIDERNTVHIRWLKWMGFTFINRLPEYGLEKRQFLEFVRIR